MFDFVPSLESSELDSTVDSVKSTKRHGRLNSRVKHSKTLENKYSKTKPTYLKQFEERGKTKRNREKTTIVPTQPPENFLHHYSMENGRVYQQKVDWKNPLH